MAAARHTHTPCKPHCSSSALCGVNHVSHPQTPHFASHTAALSTLTPLSQLSAIRSPRHRGLYGADLQGHDHNVPQATPIENSTCARSALQAGDGATEPGARSAPDAYGKALPSTKGGFARQDPLMFEISAIESQMRHFVHLKQQYNADKAALEDVERRIESLENDNSSLEESARGLRESVRWYLDTKHSRVCAIKQLTTRISELTSSLANAPSVSTTLPTRRHSKTSKTL